MTYTLLVEKPHNSIHLYDLVDYAWINVSLVHFILLIRSNYQVHAKALGNANNCFEHEYMNFSSLQTL